MNSLEVDRKIAHRHVVIVTSPIVELVAYLYFKQNSIKSRNITLITLRKYQCNLLKSQKNFCFSLGFFERAVNKIFNLSLEGLILSVLVLFRRRDFTLYSPWDLPQTFFLKRSRRCIAHFYLEEGQLSHNNYGEYDFSGKLNKERARISRWRSGHVSDILKTKVTFDGYFSSSAAGFIRIHPDAFLDKNKNKLVTLKIFSDENMQGLVNFRGTRKIGVFPAPRRLVGRTLVEVVDKLLSELGTECLIKLHPGYSSNGALRDEVIKCIHERSDGAVFVSDNAFIELEMLVEKKVLYGPTSSLELYAEFLGSEYRRIEINDPVK